MSVKRIYAWKKEIFIFIYINNKDIMYELQVIFHVLFADDYFFPDVSLFNHINSGKLVTKRPIIKCTNKKDKVNFTLNQFSRNLHCALSLFKISFLIHDQSDKVFQVCNTITGAWWTKSKQRDRFWHLACGYSPLRRLRFLKMGYINTK